MDAAAPHVAVLAHADVAVTEVVGADSGRQTFVVDQGGAGLAKTVGGCIWDAELLSTA
jgi:hypothetical protein